MDTLVLEKPTVTIEDLTEKLYRTKGKAEIINGEIVKFVSTGDEPATAASNILVSLKLYQRRTSAGRAYSDIRDF